MRLTYWRAEKNYEIAIGDAIVAGAEAAGIEVVQKPTTEYRGPENDGSICCGITRREMLWEHQARGVPLAYFDKGYIRQRVLWGGIHMPQFWRMCWQDVHPTAYLMQQSCPPDRFIMTKMQLAERQEPKHRGHIIIIGSSGKFHLAMRIDEPTSWATNITRALKNRAPGRRIIYRPKPSWKHAVPVPGTFFDWGAKTSIVDQLEGAHCAITYGSIGSVDAICAGVPVIVLGNAVTKAISGAYIHEVEEPYWPERPLREKWAANLAYSHFTPNEIQDGVAWKILKGQMKYAV